MLTSAPPYWPQVTQLKAFLLHPPPLPLKLKCLTPKLTRRQIQPSLAALLLLTRLRPQQNPAQAAQEARHLLQRATTRS